ncbi:MAG: WbqC family protein [Cyclobacteriaceae bacterium]|nr:WbqC family protein [Cyclobacteriaceae bacterium]
MKTALIDLQYLPSLEYFCALQDYSTIQLEKHEHYVKQSYRNRCYINTAQGVDMLTVPLTNKHGKVPINEVKIDYSIKWQNNHWRAIESAYRKAPFFEYYSDDLKKIIYCNYIFLFDLNLALLSFCLKNISFQPQISVSVAYEKNPEAPYYDLRSLIQAKIPYSERSFYKPVPYNQVFGNHFADNLSLIDLLFCEGPRSGSLILASRNKG